MRVPPHWASSEEAVMEYAPVSPPDIPPGGVTAGIDWATDDHVACVVDSAVKVISRNQLKNLRSRYGSAGNQDDRFDAYVLAGTLRTDRARLRPLQPDAPATISL